MRPHSCSRLLRPQLVKLPGFVAISISLGDGITLAAVAIALGGVAVAFWQARVNVVSERWGLQPIVVVYENRAMDDDPTAPDTLCSEVFLVNEGPGTALNVRFGIGLDD